MHNYTQPDQDTPTPVKHTVNLLSELVALAVLPPLLIIYYAIYLPARSACTKARIRLHRTRHRPKL